MANLTPGSSPTTSKAPELRRILSEHVSQNFAKADKLSFLIAHWSELIQVTTENLEDTRDDIGAMLRSLSIIQVSENLTKV